MLRERKPSLLIEIGSGESTKVSLLALEKNATDGGVCQMISVEPFPMPYLRDIKCSNFKLFETKVQDVGIEILPMKALQSQMSSGVPYYEGEFYNVIRQGRGVPSVPLIIIGIMP